MVDDGEWWLIMIHNDMEGFHKWGYPQMAGFVVESLVKWRICGTPILGIPPVAMQRHVCLESRNGFRCHLDLGPNMGIDRYLGRTS